MRLAFVKALIDTAKKNENIHLLTADLGFEVIEDYINKFSQRFTNVGVAEANLIGIAGGIAHAGLIPVCYSIGTFVTYRCFEQIRNDICYPNLNVKIVGVGSGMAYGYNGPSHQSLEDVAIMRTLPNMTIICPSDPIETYIATKEMLRYPGPVYLRLNKKGEPNLSYEYIKDFVIGKIIRVREGKELVIFSMGIMLEIVLEVADKLELHGIFPSIVHVHTIKPIDSEAIKKIISEHSLVVTIEEHNFIGGLGSVISEINTSDNGCLKRQLIIGIEDKFYNIGGSQGYLRKIAGLDSESITNKILQWK